MRPPMPRGIPRRTGRPVTSSASSGMPWSSVEPPVSTTPLASKSSCPAFWISRCTSWNNSSTRGSMISQRMRRLSTRGARPPTLGTSMVSCRSSVEPCALPYLILIFSVQTSSPATDVGAQALLTRLLDLAVHLLDQLLDARLDDLAEDAPVEHAGRAAADAGHFDGVVPVERRALRAAELDLDLLRLVHRRAQADRDVVGEVIAAQRNDAGVLDRAAGENGHVGGAAADVDQRHPQLLLLVGQHRLGAGERLEHDVAHLQAGLGAALDDVL